MFGNSQFTLYGIPCTLLLSFSPVIYVSYSILFRVFAIFLTLLTSEKAPHCTLYKPLSLYFSINFIYDIIDFAKSCNNFELYFSINFIYDIIQNFDT